jgi:hypothetical protein
MPHPNTRSRKSAAAAVVILLLACIGLAACGGSSSKTSSSANAASVGTASTGTTSTGASSNGTSPSGSGTSTPGVGRGGARFAALRECLEKNGITLPTRTPGSGRPAGGPGGFLGDGAQLPKGVTRAQYEAALKKCGGHVFGGAGARFANNPVFKAALAKYAECLRQNGVNVPAPNTSGKGPVFDTKGIDTSSPRFRAATTKCRSTLTGAFRRPGGAGGPAPGGGGAPAGGTSNG